MAEKVEKLYRVKMLQAMAGDHSADFNIGEEIELPESQAQRLVLRGLAKAIDPLPELPAAERQRIRDGRVQDIGMREVHDDRGDPIGMQFDTAPLAPKRENVVDKARRKVFGGSPA